MVKRKRTQEIQAQVEKVRQVCMYRICANNSQRPHISPEEDEEEDFISDDGMRFDEDGNVSGEGGNGSEGEEQGSDLEENEDEGSDELVEELREHVANKIGKLARPKRIIWSGDLPKTRSGKIMRRILRKIAEDDFGSLGDTSTLADPTVVDDLIDNRQNKKG